MKKFLFAFALLLASSNFISAQIVNKTLVQTINPSSSSKISLGFTLPFEVKPWGDDNVRIILDVKLDNANEQVLEQLVLAGRYKIETVKEGDNFKINIPNITKKVTIRGQELKENITAYLYTPRSVKVDDSAGKEVSLSREVGGSNIDGMASRSVKMKFKKKFEFETKLQANKNAPKVSNDDILIDGVSLSEILKENK